MENQNQKVYKGVSPISIMKKQIITSTRTAYSDKCDICKQEIKGFSESNLEYNMRLHKEKCEKTSAEKRGNR